MRESVIRRMTRLAVQHEAINLSQGFTDESPDFDLVWGGIAAAMGGTDEGMAHFEQLSMGQILSRMGGDMAGFLKMPLKTVFAHLQAKADRFNQYSYPFGLAELRTAIADYTERLYRFRPDPETQITVVLGATEGLSSLLRATCKPGDGLVVFQPFHEMYLSQAELFGLVPRFVTLREDQGKGKWQMDREEVERVAAGARALVLNTPHNPTGKVFDREDMDFLAQLCQRWDLWAFTDEIYEHILYDGRRHYCLAAFEGMAERTFVVNSISKTGSATGWRIGWVISPPQYTTQIRSVHDTLVVQAPTPLQKGAERLLSQEEGFYREMGETYARKREILLGALRQVGFRLSAPEGAYYLFAKYRQVPALRDLAPMEAAMYLIERVGVASVPGDNFYQAGDEGNDYLRFAFCRSLDTLEVAKQRLVQGLGRQV